MLRDKKYLDNKPFFVQSKIAIVDAFLMAEIADEYDFSKKK